MTFKAEIPYGAYWSTPFARWQGSFANLHSIEFAAHVAKRELAKRKIDPAGIDYGVLGFSVGAISELDPVLKAYKRGIANCEPVGAFVNDNLLVVSQAENGADPETSFVDRVRSAGAPEELGSEFDQEDL